MPKPTRVLALALFICLLLLIIEIGVVRAHTGMDRAVAQPPSLTSYPFLQAVTESSVVVIWETREPVVGTVDYGPTTALGQSMSEPLPVQSHRVEITELEPGMIYHFRVRYGDVQLNPSRFMTTDEDETVMPEEPMPDNLYIWPYLQDVTQHSIVVMWETTEPVVGTVHYGADKDMAESVTESEPVTIHELEITGLEPGKRYHYQAGYGDVRLDASTFKTAPPDGTREAKILLYGDSRSYPGRHRRVVEQIVPYEPDLIINSGDLVSNGQVYEQWKPQHFWPLRIVSDHIPIYTCPGNHERNAKHYFNYVSLPGNEVYYSFDYANIHFISLDSNSSYTPYAEASPQYQWLVQDLEANQDAEWIIVFYHHPSFRVHPGRGIEPQRYSWQHLFDKYGVDLVVAGHDHHYGRIRPIGELMAERRNGVTYVTTGGGGASLYDVTEARSHIAIARKIHNVVKFTVQGDRAEAVVTDVFGNHVETFVLDKNEPTATDEFIAYEVFEVERDLRKAISELEPIAVESADARVEFDHTLSIPTSFDVRLEGEITWDMPEGTETSWAFEAPETEFVINPGANLRIPLKATAQYPDIYPVPGVTVHFSKIVGRLPVGFRNDHLTFHPVKVQPRLPISVPRIYTGLLLNGERHGIHLDGKLDDGSWYTATSLSRFVSHQGDEAPGRSMRVRLVHDGVYLYVGAAMEADPMLMQSLLESTPRQRDDRYIIRGEFFSVQLSPGDETFLFAVDPLGAQLEAREYDRTWNFDWAATAQITESGWNAEMAIPIAAFGESLQDKVWRLNLVRWDDADEEASMLTPTFELRTTENRLPEYGPGIGDPAQLPVVTFEGL